ncbi:hypothetical protein Bbelb_200980 [Branchiostoma belcheri]|nr:hypothetical protein Bbelb_200980 [Branchiostoma belcheri]
MSVAMPEARVLRSQRSISALEGGQTPPGLDSPVAHHHPTDGTLPCTQHPGRDAPVRGFDQYYIEVEVEGIGPKFSTVQLQSSPTLRTYDEECGKVKHTALPAD